MLNCTHYTVFQALGQSTLQTQANQVARQMNIDVQALALEITQSCKISSPSYQESVPKTHTWCYPHTSVWCHPLLVQTNGCVSSLASSGVRTEHQQQQACLTTPSLPTARTVLVRERSRAARPRLDQLLYFHLVGSLSSRLGSVFFNELSKDPVYGSTSSPNS